MPYVFYQFKSYRFYLCILWLFFFRKCTSINIIWLFWPLTSRFSVELDFSLYWLKYVGSKKFLYKSIETNLQKFFHWTIVMGKILQILYNHGIFSFSSFLIKNWLYLEKDNTRMENNVFVDVESATMNEFAWGMDLNKLLQFKMF